MPKSVQTLPLSLLACPACKSPLEQEGETLACTGTGCGCRFAYRNGIPDLVTRSPASAKGQTAACAYPATRPGRVSPTSPFCHYAITNRLILRYSKTALAAIAGTGVNFGAGTITYGELLPAGATMWHVDIRPQPGTELHLLTDIQECGIATGHLDWILCTSVLEHIPRPRRAMREMARCLKPGGRLILTVPQTFPLHSQPADFWRFTPHGIRILAEEAGLCVESLTPLGSPRSIEWQQRAARFNSRYGGTADPSLARPKRLVLNAVSVVSLLHSALCCIAAGRGKAAPRVNCDALCWGAQLVKQDRDASG